MVRMVQVAATVVASLAAGQFAAIVTQPFDVVKTIVQADRGVTHPFIYRSPLYSLEAARALAKEAGAGVFWRGLAPRSLRCASPLLRSPHHRRNTLPGREWAGRRGAVCICAALGGTSHHVCRHRCLLLSGVSWRCSCWASARPPSTPCTPSI